MPAMQPVPGVVKVFFFHTFGNEPATGFHMFFGYGGGAPTGANLTALATAMATSWNTHVAPLAPSSVTLVKVTATDLASAAAPIGTWTGAHAGTNAVAANPANVCVLINGAVTRRYRGGKPRFYILMGTQADVNDPQHWKASSVTSFSASFQGLINDASANMSWASPFILANVRYFSGHTWQQDQHGNWHRLNTPLIPPAVENIISTGASSIIGSQRRRLRPG